MSDLAARLLDVKARIARAEEACGRPVGSVALIAVSKTKPASAIREAYAAGQRAFGENYAQELATKAKELEDLDDLEWHFIGHLQSNKAKLVVPVTHTVHTVDGASLAKELGRRAEKAHVAPLRVLVEVNVGGEPQKFGVTPGELEETIQAVLAQPALSLQGLMTIPPEGGREVARRAFETLLSLRALHGGEARLPELSMGMSADLEEAVASGATMVRVGTAIFGER
jgi:pyridoxal phosphate enzyme (YggS family)